MQVRKSLLSTISALVVLEIFFILVTISLKDGAYFVYGNVHDLFIPLNSAYALSQGLELHTEFHSPFGLFYHLLNYFSYVVTLTWPQRLHALDTILVSSALFSIIFTVLFLAVRLLQSEDQKLSIWVYVVLITLIFQLRNPNLISEYLPYWYGVYNYQCWALLIIQIAHCVTYSRQEKTPRCVSIFAIVQAIFFLIAMHYKISFLAASGVVAIAAIFQMPVRLTFTRYIPIGLGVVSSVVIAIGFTGYDYLGFINDNQMAIRGRMTSPKKLSELYPLLVGFLVFLVGFQLLRFQQIINVRANLPAIQQLYTYWVQGIWPLMSPSQVTFDILIGLAILTASLGDFTLPWVYFIIILWVIPFNKSVKWSNQSLARIALFIFVLLFSYLNFQSLKSIAAIKITSNSWSTGPNKKLSVSEIDAFPEPYRVAIVSELSTTQLLTDGLFIKSPDWDKKIVRLSYTFSPKDIWENNQPKNNQYIEDVNQVIHTLKEFGVPPQSGDLISTLAFSNPYPILLQTPLSDQSFNWIHVGTTFSPEDTDFILDKLSSADFLVMPSRGQMIFTDNVFLNCRFYAWNAMNAPPFKGVAIAGTAIIFASRKTMEKYGLEELFSINSEEIKDECNKLELYTKYFPVPS